MATTTATTATHPVPDPSQPQPTSPSTVTDPTLWTTPQELTLLRAVTHTKPAGMHKHFRMIAIQDALLSSGTIHAPEDERHASSIKGIWAKLRSLYDLRALDEREDAIISSGDGGEDGGEGDEDGEGENEYWREFDLASAGLGVEGEFEELMWERRLAGSGSGEGSSPAPIPVTESEDKGNWRGSEVGDSEDLRSSPAAEGSIRGRGTRSAKRGRLAEVKGEIKAEASASPSGRSSARKASKAASPVEDTEMPDADGENIEEEEEGEEDEDESEQESEDEKKETRSRTRATRSRARGRRRGKGS